MKKSGMSNKIKIVSPINGSVVAERMLASNQEISSCLENAVESQSRWAKKSVKERAVVCHRAIDYLVDNMEKIAKEVTLQMGRPIRYAQGEISGLEERARYMIEIAQLQLEKISVGDKPQHNRFIRREPLGVVFTIAPWNYPYLTAVNSVIPALMAGNSVILKHSAQTLLCAERFYEAFKEAGLDHGVFQYLHLNHKQTADIIKDKRINFISFTGSVSGGEKIEEAVSGLFKGVALELGGKDPAYVRNDADLKQAVEDLVEGAFFNSGQSCCAIERIYVHKDVYKEFTDAYVNMVKDFKLGDSLDQEVTIGPMVNAKAANYVRQQIKQACEMGAIAHIDENKFVMNQPGTAYLAPQVLTEVNHQMSVMMDESFGPVVGIMKVEGDAQAIELMNDSPYGLTASIWTADESSAIKIGEQIQTGTVYMNRCDYLDPALAWVGVKCSGRGCSLSALAYEQLTRPKSFNLKVT